MTAPELQAGGPMPPELARRVKLVLFDVDGVLTDAAVWLGELPGGKTVELKRFDIQDGLGLKMLRWSGLEVAMVSGRISEATKIRARELGVACRQAPEGRKLPLVRDLLELHDVRWDEVAMLADDLPDLAVFRRVGLPAAVANAVPEIVELAVWRATRPGGSGGAREFCDALLEARGDRDWVVERYEAERS